MTASRGVRRKHLPFGCWVVSESKGYETPCHIWTGNVGSHGYGTYAGSLAHRAAFRRANGDIPEGLSIDHLCRNRLCVNPDHLEAVTLAENTRREWDAVCLEVNGRRVRKTHCKNGHFKNGKRTCPVCKLEIQARHRAKIVATFGVGSKIGGLGKHTNAHIEHQRQLRNEKARLVVKLYREGVPTPEIAKVLGRKDGAAVYRYLKVAGVKPSRAEAA